MERFGAYLLYEQLGPGERGTVHRATLAAGDESARTVAVKRLPASLLAAGEAMDAAQVSQLRHPNIVVVYRVGRLGETAYVEMEHVVGHSIDELLHGIRTNGPPPVDVVVSLVVEMSRALEFAHSQGLVHGAIRPCHLLVDSDGHLKMLGFGMAELEPEPGNPAQQCYAAPESIQGAPADERADLYSVGVVAYELVTGRPLFDEHLDAELRSCLASRIEPPATCNPECPPELDQLIVRALASEPEQRWATASELRGALESVGEPVPERVREWLGQALPPTIGPPPVPPMPAPPRRTARGTGRLPPPAGALPAGDSKAECSIYEDEEVCSRVRAAALARDRELVGPSSSVEDDDLLAAIDAADSADESIHDAETVIHDDETIIHDVAPHVPRDLQLPLVPPCEVSDYDVIVELNAADEEKPADAVDGEEELAAVTEAIKSLPVPESASDAAWSPESEPGLSRRVELALAFVAGVITTYVCLALFA